MRSRSMTRLCCICWIPMVSPCSGRRCYISVVIARRRSHAFHSDSGRDRRDPASRCAPIFTPRVGPLKLFASNDEVAALESRLDALVGTDRCAVLLPLAWHLRQRDSRRALALADEADVLLHAAESSPIELARAVARLSLLRAEIRMLFADPVAAQQMAQSALQAFSALDDLIGVGDTHWLKAS